MRAGHAGVTNLVVTLAAAAYLGFGTRQLNLGWIYDSYVPLMSAAIALSFALSVGAVVIGCVSAAHKQLACHGQEQALWH